MNNSYHEQARAARAESKRRQIEEAAQAKLESTRVGTEDAAFQAKQVESNKDMYMQKALDAEAADPQLAEAGPRQITAMSLYFFCLVAAAGIDYIAGSNPVTFILSLAGLVNEGVGRLWFVLAKLAFPFFFLGIEMWIAAMIVEAQNDGKRTAVQSWSLLGGGIALVMAALFAGTFIAGAGVDSVFDLPASELLLFAAVTFFAFVPHAVIVYGGRLASDAKGYLYLEWLKAKMRRLDKRFEAYKHAAYMSFQEHAKCAIEAGLPTQFGLLSAYARDLINEHAGALVLGPPGAFGGDGYGAVPDLEEDGESEFH